MNFGGGFGGLGNIMGMMGGSAAQNPNAPQPDTTEKVYISALALIKMLKHSRAGVPMEVMGLMLGEMVDEYIVNVVDVFAMPQSGTSVSVESVDPVFQQDMLDLLRQTERMENVVGWYHSHPSFGCWLSSVDQQTQMSFEQLNPRAVAVVIDPIQSVRGNVVIDAFRLIEPTVLLSGRESRQTTGMDGSLVRPLLEQQLRGVGIHYYQLSVAFKTNEIEQKMLQNLYKASWQKNLAVANQTIGSTANVKLMQEMVQLAKMYTKMIQEETDNNDKGGEKMLKVKNTGKIDPKRHLLSLIDEAENANVAALLTNNLATQSM